MKLFINRLEDDGTQTLGHMIVFDGTQAVYQCKTLELAWKDNKPFKSCIPKGTYPVRKRWSEKHKSHFHVTNVEGRSWILIHKGNYHTDIEGCILVGDGLKDINNDGLKDVVNSKNTLSTLYLILPDQFEVTIC